jgi:hypothetical protein
MDMAQTLQNRVQVKGGLLTGFLPPAFCQWAVKHGAYVQHYQEAYDMAPEKLSIPTG